MNGNDPRRQRPAQTPSQRRPQQPQNRPAQQRDALDERYEEMVDAKMRSGMVRDEQTYHTDRRADAINRGKYADLSSFESKGHRKISPQVMRARRRKQLLRKLLPLCGLLILIVIALVVYLGVMRPASLYEHAVEDFEVQNYNAARDHFIELGDYKETEKYIAYIDATFAFDRGEYTDAANRFTALGEFLDSASRAQTALDRADPSDENESAYQAACRKLNSGDYGGARTAFLALGDYKDSAAKAEQASKDEIYAKAEEALAAGDTAGARELFVSLGEYRDATTRVQALDRNTAANEQERAYQSALEEFGFKDYRSANAAFLALGNYKDSKKYADYTYGMLTYSAGEYATAADCFTACGENFLDSAQRARESKYEQACIAYRNGEYETAIALFGELGDFSDSAAQLASATVEYQAHCYQNALYAYYGGDLAEALTIFTELGDYQDSAEWVKRIAAEQAGQ